MILKLIFIKRPEDYITFYKVLEAYVTVSQNLQS